MIRPKEAKFTKRIRLGHTKKESYVITIPKKDVVDLLKLKNGSYVEVTVRKVK